MRSLRKNPPEVRYSAIVHSIAEMHPFCIFFVPEPNAQKHSQTCSSVYLGRLHAFVAKKSTRASLPGNSAFGCRNAPVLHHFSCRNRMPKNTPKHVLVYIKEDCMRSLRKNPPNLRYPPLLHAVPPIYPFCIFFVPEPNAQKHSQTCSSVYLGRLHAFVAKKSTRVSLPGNSAFGCRNAPVLHRFTCRNRMPKNTPKNVLCPN